MYHPLWTSCVLVQVRTHMSGRHQMYDKPHRADEPSVWQIIADHQDQQDQPTKAK